MVMGVTGSGKTTVGLRLAAEIRAQFADGDEFHSPDAVAKMAADVPLTDDDRLPWLERVGEWLAAGDDRVIACSALRRSYRDVIRAYAPTAVFIELWADQGLLEDRVRTRSAATGHFAGAGLLDSTLPPGFSMPTPDDAPTLRDDEEPLEDEPLTDDDVDTTRDEPA